jgi:hypothetical protein
MSCQSECAVGRGEVGVHLDHFTEFVYCAVILPGEAQHQSCREIHRQRKRIELLRLL